MSLENNRQDFEQTLKKLEEALTELNDILAKNYIGIFSDVLNEYNYFIGDVEDLYTENERLQELVDKAELETQNE